jgi:simple sugar transport system permease protein
MGEILDIAFISGLIGATMRMATPIIFATLGEILAERSGVLNGHRGHHADGCHDRLSHHF